MSEIVPKSIAGRYQIMKILGAGAVGQVFLCQDRDGKFLALKLLDRSFHEKKSCFIINKFKSEFSILREISHPDIGRVIDFGFDEELSQYYFTSEFIDGTDFLTATQDLTTVEIEELFVQALRALEYLHMHGIIHFDIKSANVLVTKKNNALKVKLIDFGLASLGSENRIVGTPAYMAPEIILKNNPDARADIYSLGILIYAALTHTNPFKTSGFAETFKRQIELVPDPPSTYRTDLKPYLDEIIMTMLKKMPSERISSAFNVIRAINLGGDRIYPIETIETSASYVPSQGNIVGRDKELQLIKEQVINIKNGKDDEPFILCVEGGTGTGKSRLLVELKFFAQLNDFNIVELKSTDIGFIDDFNKQLADIHGNINRPSVIICRHLNKIITDKPAYSVILNIKNLLTRINIERGLRSSSSEPRILFAFKCDPDERALFEQLLEIEKNNINLIKTYNFDRSITRKYLSAVTGISDVPEAFLDDIFKRTEGNPLFITEITNNLIRSGKLYDKEGRWNRETIEDIGFDLDSLDVPDNLEEITERRFLALSEHEKRLVELIAAYNGPVNYTDIGSVLKVNDPGKILRELVGSGIITSNMYDVSFSFSNPIMKQFVYSKINPRTKRVLHELIAEHIESSYPERTEDIRWHKCHVSDIKTATDASIDLAVYYLRQTRPYKAMPILKNGIERAKKSGYKTFELMLHLGEAEVLARNYDNAINIYNELIEVAEEKSNNKNDIALIYQKLGIAYLRNSRINPAKESLIRGLKYAAQDGPLYLKISNYIGRSLFLEGKPDEAIRIYSENRNKWALLSNEEKAMVTNNDLPHLYLQSGKLNLAEKMFKEDIRFLKKIGSLDELERSYYSLASLYLEKKDYKQADNYFNAAIDIAKDVSDPEILLRSYNGLGNLHFLLRQNKKSLYWYERALGLSLRTGDNSTSAAILTNIGLIKKDEGNNEEAVRHFKSAINIFERSGKKTALDKNLIKRAHAELAELYGSDKKNGHPAISSLHRQESVEISEVPACTEITHSKTIKSIIGIHLKEGGSDKMEDIKYKYILEINKYLSGETDFIFVIKTILKYAVELSGAESGILLLKKDADIEIVSHVNTRTDLLTSEFSKSIAKEAMDQNRIIYTRDAINDARFNSNESVALMNLKSVICIPVRIKKNVVGAIYLENRSNSEAFDRSDNEVMLAFADQAGIAIDNGNRINAFRENEEKLKDELSETSAIIDRLNLQLDNRSPSRTFSFDRVKSENPKMKTLFSLLKRISGTELSILVVGESGTGKELIARAIHQNSSRNNGPFVPVNCSAIPASLIESELFGYRAGAFTGAVRDKMGFFQAANNGTLFLDEIAELDISLQAKILRAIQEKEIIRVGDTKNVKLNIRIISATNKDLAELTKTGTFREDLYYRIAEIRADLPPLRERSEDIPLLINEFIEEYCDQHKIKNRPKADPSFTKSCMEYNWPGNIRELENTVRVATALSENEEIKVACLPENHALRKLHPSEMEDIAEGGNLLKIDSNNAYFPEKKWKNYEAEILASAHKKFNYDAKITAEKLDLAVTTVYKKISEFRLKDKSNKLYSSGFQYTETTTMNDYIIKIFKASWEHFGKHPYQAIRALGISQGYFYKIMKQF